MSVVAGPASCLPFLSKHEPWQGQSHSFSTGFDCRQHIANKIHSRSSITTHWDTEITEGLLCCHNTTADSCSYIEASSLQLADSFNFSQISQLTVSATDTISATDTAGWHTCIAAKYA